MKKIFFIILLLFCINPCFAILEQKTIIVLNDDNVLGNNYFVFTKSSDLIAREIINNINLKDGMYKAYRQDFIKKKIEYTYNKQNYENFINKYKTSYAVDFDDLKNINKYIKSDYALVISSNTDVQSEFLKETFWNVLNVPGQDVVKPEYILSVHISFIDLNKNEVLFEDTFKEYIKEKNLNMAMSQNGPNYTHLAEINKIARKLSKKVIEDIEYSRTHDLLKTMNNFDCKKAIYNENYHKKVAQMKKNIKTKKAELKQRKIEKQIIKNNKNLRNIKQKEDLKRDKKLNKINEKIQKEEIKRLEKEKKDFEKQEAQRLKDFEKTQEKIIKIKNKKYYSEEKKKKELTEEQKRLIKLIENL